MKHIAMVSCVMLAIGGSAMAQRPTQYPPAWGQFLVYQFGDARRVCLARLGCGPDRPAEITILEMMPDGKEMRPLFQRALITEFIWWQAYSVSGGRFLVTLNDRFVSGSSRERSIGETPNTIVVYDLVRGTHAAFAAEQFLTPEVIRRDDGLDGLFGTGHILDAGLDVLHITDAREAREHGVPYLVIDLPSMKVLTLPPPTIDEEKHLLNQGVDVRLSKPYSWETASRADRDPDWSSPLQFPQYLRGELSGPAATPAFLGPEARILCFKWDARRNTYIRCSEEEWGLQPKLNPPDSPKK